jgi:hypothetical protein
MKRICLVLAVAAVMAAVLVVSATSVFAAGARFGDSSGQIYDGGAKQCKDSSLDPKSCRPALEKK